MADYEIFKASLGCLEFQMDLRVHLKCIMTQMTQLKEEHTYFTIANVQQIGFGSSCFSFVLRKGEWVISKSTEIFKELKLRLDH